MAISISNIRVHGRNRIQAVLLSAVTGTGNGEWIHMAGLAPFSVRVAGITTATVEVDGDNALARPADNTHGSPLATAVTADGYINITTPAEWVKARCTAYTSGTITATLVATGAR